LLRAKPTEGADARSVLVLSVARELTSGKDQKQLVAAMAPAIALQHPNLVQVREVATQDEDVFLVAELKEGETAASLLARLASRGETLDFGLAAHIVAEACAGLERAHEASIVHERLTPHDILVGYDGSVEVMGVGIAASLATLGEPAIGRELAYASPERCKGERAEVRSDVFSLGAILWELMSGVSPFARGDDAATIRAIISEDPAIPSSNILRNMPMRFSEIATSALARDRAKRYATARALRHELLSFLRGLPASEPAATRLATCMASVFDRPTLGASRPPAISYPEDRLSGEVTKLAPLPPLNLDADPAPVASPSPPAPAPEEPSDARSRRSRRIAVGALGLLCALAVAGLVPTLLSRQSPAPSRTSPASSSTPSTPSTLSQATASAGDGTLGAASLRPAPTSADVASAKASEQTTVHIETTPDKSTVVVAGTPRGQTPLDLRLPRSATPVDVELRHAGYQTLKESIVPDMDQKLRLALVPVPPQVRATAPSASAGPYYRFE
jgi:serine/threonine-protein kinase